jgi:serine protease Do
MMSGEQGKAQERRVAVVRLRLLPMLLAVSYLLPFLWAQTIYAAGQPVSTLYVSAAETVSPCVVTIRTQTRKESRVPVGQRLWRPWKRENKTEGEGTGIVISSDGDIVTNWHVVYDSQELEVTFDNGFTYSAHVQGHDSVTDIAVISICDERFSSPLPLRMVVRWGNSDVLRIGQPVMVCGDPYGLSHSFSHGIISALGRSPRLGEARALNNLVQIDAPINPGNSGGPLFDLHGDVVGMVTTYREKGAGLSFALPSNLVRRVAGELRIRGRAGRPRIGLEFVPVSMALALKLGMDRLQGVVVTAVDDGGPAALAGIKKSDIIIAADHVPIKNSGVLYGQVQETGDGEPLILSVRRGNRLTDIRVTVRCSSP